VATTKRISDTAKSRNIEIELAEVISLDEMEVVLTEVATELGLYVSHTTVLGRVKYPGNRHWHLKRTPDTPGCLDLTYWPQGELLWISIRNNEPGWVHDSGQRLEPALEAALGNHHRHERGQSVRH